MAPKRDTLGDAFDSNNPVFHPSRLEFAGHEGRAEQSKAGENRGRALQEQSRVLQHQSIAGYQPSPGWGMECHFR